MAFLEMVDVNKRYGGVVALEDASLTAERGELHALLGPNGSGKSTLIKTLTGVVDPDSAEIRVDGRSVRFRDPSAAQALGISAVYQDLSLVPDLSVEENVSLGMEPARFGLVDRGRRSRAVREVVDRLRGAFDGHLPLEAPVSRLSPGEQQVVELCKAMLRRPRILVLDEATASLHHAQVRAVFEVLRELRDEGVLVIFTSHRLEEVFELCDGATVLRSGSTVGSVELATTSQVEVVQMMLGRELAALEETRAQEDVERPVILQVRGLGTERLHDVSFSVREGEILGIAGLQGQGQEELLDALFGAERIRAGDVLLEGRHLRLRSPRHAIRAGMALIPGERTRQGLFSRRPILENLTLASAARRALPGGFVRGGRERSAAEEAIRTLQIKVGRLQDPVWTLSGGNQQKVVVGRWLLTRPRVILMDDPTKGIDVGAKEELYGTIRNLSQQGVAILWSSSENLELIRLCHRVLVIFEGRVVGELQGSELTEDQLLTASMRVDEAAG